VASPVGAAGGIPATAVVSVTKDPSPSSAARPLLGGADGRVLGQVSGLTSWSPRRGRVDAHLLGGIARRGGLRRTLPAKDSAPLCGAA